MVRLAAWIATTVAWEWGEHEPSVRVELLPEVVGGARRLTPSGRGYAGNALQVICDLRLIPSAEQALDAVSDGSADLDN